MKNIEGFNVKFESNDVDVIRNVVIDRLKNIRKYIVDIKNLNDDMTDDVRTPVLGDIILLSHYQTMLNVDIGLVEDYVDTEEEWFRKIIDFKVSLIAFLYMVSAKHTSISKDLAITFERRVASSIDTTLKLLDEKIISL